MTDTCCAIARHECQKQLDEFLTANWTSKKINDWLLSKGVPYITPDVYSRHRRHLGLEKKALGRPPGKQWLPDVDDNDAPPADFPVPDIAEARDEALRVFFWRLKTNPKKVTNQQLVPVLTKALEHDAKRPQRSAIEDIIAQLADSEPVDVMGRVGRRDDSEPLAPQEPAEAGSDPLVPLATAVAAAAGGS